MKMEDNLRYKLHMHGMIFNFQLRFRAENNIVYTSKQISKNERSERSTICDNYQVLVLLLVFSLGQVQASV